MEEMLDLAMKVGTELTTVLASIGDVTGDVIKDKGDGDFSFLLTILMFVAVSSRKVGEATGICSGTLDLIGTSLGMEVLLWNGRGSCLAGIMDGMVGYFLWFVSD